jgi:hypothetical protein
VHVRACHAVTVCAPELMLLVARTTNLRIRNAALFALSSFAYSPASAQLLIRLGGLELVLAFFPFCVNPRSRQVSPDLLDAEAYPPFEVVPTRVSRYDGALSSCLGISTPSSRLVPTIEDTARATTDGSVISGTVFSILPVPLFTLLAALARFEPLREDICKSGLLQACIDRFVLETENSNADLKVRIVVVLHSNRGLHPEAPPVTDPSGDCHPVVTLRQQKLPRVWVCKRFDSRQATDVQS